jgi:hypothetical protein
MIKAIIMMVVQVLLLNLKEQNTGKTPVAEQWRQIAYGTRQWSP